MEIWLASIQFKWENATTHVIYLSASLMNVNGEEIGICHVIISIMDILLIWCGCLRLSLMSLLKKMCRIRKMKRTQTLLIINNGIDKYYHLLNNNKWLSRRRRIKYLLVNVLVLIVPLSCTDRNMDRK